MFFAIRSQAVGRASVGLLLLFGVMYTHCLVVKYMRSRIYHTMRMDPT